jgi:hypothetical protein
VIVTPSRIIKESICTSSSIDSLSWFEEVFFYRLITQCDDFGRTDARPAILRSRLFPLKDVTNKIVEAALSKLVTAGMVRVYVYDRQPFLQLENWGKHQRLRDAKGKYPAPPEETDNSPQLAATCGELPLELESNPNPNIPMADESAVGAEEVDADDVFEKIYQHFPRKVGKATGKTRFMQFITKGRKLGASGLVRLNHQQIAVAVKRYAEDVSGREEDKIKHFDTFMGESVLDYVEKTKDDYEAYMLKRYGDNWRKVKFVYGRSGSG